MSSARFTFPYGIYRSSSGQRIDCRRETLTPLVEPEKRVVIVEPYLQQFSDRPIGTCVLSLGDEGVEAHSVEWTSRLRVTGDLTFAFVGNIDDTGLFVPKLVREAYFTTQRLERELSSC